MSTSVLTRLVPVVMYRPSGDGPGSFAPSVVLRVWASTLAMHELAALAEHSRQGTRLDIYDPGDVVGESKPVWTFTRPKGDGRW